MRQKKENQNEDKGRRKISAIYIQQNFKVRLGIEKYFERKYPSRIITRGKEKDEKQEGGAIKGQNDIDTEYYKRNSGKHPIRNGETSDQET